MNELQMEYPTCGLYRDDSKRYRSARIVRRPLRPSVALSHNCGSPQRRCMPRLFARAIKETISGGEGSVTQVCRKDTLFPTSRCITRDWDADHAPSPRRSD